MDRQTIGEILPEIPVTEPDVPVDFFEHWTAEDGGAKFTLLHHHYRDANGKTDYYVLTISGETEERRRLYNEFWACLGEPIEADIVHEENHSDKITWFHEPSLQQ